MDKECQQRNVNDKKKKKKKSEENSRIKIPGKC